MSSARKTSKEEGRKISKEEGKSTNQRDDEMEPETREQRQRREREDSENSIEGILSRDRTDSELSINSIAAAEEEASVKKDERTRYQILRDFAREAASELVKVFIDYGPPWIKTDAEMAAALIATVSNPDPKTLSLHFLLNRLYNPNIPDPEDLHNYAMHLCARNTHYLQMRMLRRAGAYINVTNEMGQTPLMVLVFYRHPPTKRPTQLKAVQWLLRQGADPNARDKGGYTALDFAAMNGDEESVQMMLEYGAIVRRENQTFVAKRKPVLGHTWNPKVYRVIHAKLQEENEEFKVTQEAKKKLAAIAAEEKKYAKSMSNWNKRKAMKKEAKELEEKENKIQKEKQERVNRISADMQAEEERKKVVKLRYGEWKRDMYGRWHWQNVKPRSDDTHVWPEGVKEMQRLRTLTAKEKYNSKWKELTGGGNLELPWKLGEAFEPEEDESKAENEDGAGGFLDELEGNTTTDGSSYTSQSMTTS